MHKAVVVLFQRSLFKNGTQHILILHLAHPKNADGTVLRHRQNRLVYVVPLLVEPAFRPMLHTVLSKGIVRFCAVHKGVEKILHVPESDADGLVLG